MDTRGIIKCSYCKEFIEYNEDDLIVGGDPFGLLEIYIECPECGKSITVGVAPSIIPATYNMG